MKPKSPFTQPFEDLPDELPVHPLENALLPGGELPLELAAPNDLAMVMDALRADQLIGMVLPRENGPDGGIHQIGCAGRIRQYRERKDGRLNVMLTGICRFRITDELASAKGYRMARVDWRDYAQDYLTEDVDAAVVDSFRAALRRYFDRHTMQVKWEVLDKLPIEEVVNNLVLILNLGIDGKQRLLEAPTVADRLNLFAELLEQKGEPIRAPAFGGKLVN